FVAEFQVDGVHLIVPKTRLIQIYQSLDEGDDPQPFLAQIKLGEAAHGSKAIATHPLARALDIEFIEEEDPDVLPSLQVSLDMAHLFKSKLQGIDPRGLVEPKEKQFL